MIPFWSIELRAWMQGYFKASCIRCQRNTRFEKNWVKKNWRGWSDGKRREFVSSLECDQCVSVQSHERAKSNLSCELAYNQVMALCGYPQNGVLP